MKIDEALRILSALRKASDRVWNKIGDEGYDHRGDLQDAINSANKLVDVKPEEIEGT